MSKLLLRNICETIVFNIAVVSHIDRNVEVLFPDVRYLWKRYWHIYLTIRTY